MSDHRFYYVSPAGKLVRVGTPEEGLAAAAQRKGFLWLDYCQPSQDELSAPIIPINRIAACSAALSVLRSATSRAPGRDRPSSCTSSLTTWSTKCQ